MGWVARRGLEVREKVDMQVTTDWAAARGDEAVGIRRATTLKLSVYGSNEVT